MSTSPSGPPGRALACAAGIADWYPGPIKRPGSVRTLGSGSATHTIPAPVRRAVTSCTDSIWLALCGPETSTVLRRPSFPNHPAPMRSLLLLAALALLAVPAQAQDVSEDANYGDVTLEEGFMPDPHEMSILAGGSVAVDVGGCSYGNVSNAPDVELTYETSGGSDLYIYAVSGDDTTILVNTATGSWVCDDDSYGDGDPIVIIRNAPAGVYDIWIGTYGDEMADASFYISEMDPR